MTALASLMAELDSEKEEHMRENGIVRRNSEKIKELEKKLSSLNEQRQTIEVKLNEWMHHWLKDQSIVSITDFELKINIDWRVYTK